MTGKYSGDLVLIDFIPASLGHGVLFGNDEAWMQVAGEGKALVEDQGDAVIRVTGCGDDLAVQPKRCEEFATIRKLQKEIIILFDLKGREVLGFEEIVELIHEPNLAFHEDHLCAEFFEILHQSGVVGMKVCDEDVFDLLREDAFAFEFRRELREGVVPAAINEEVSVLDLDGVVVGGLVAEVDDVHG